MENRYLYKAKSIYSGEWVQGYYEFINNHHYIYSGSLYSCGLYIVPERFEINIDTLCACTGLTDKNGKLEMKQRELVKKLESAGFEFVRHGGNHDIYKRGDDEEKIPRHREVNERLAKAILRKWGL